MSDLAILIRSLSTGDVLLPALRSFLDREASLLAKGRWHKADMERAEELMTIRACRRRIAEFNHGVPGTERLFHPSSIGDCMRRIWYRHFNAPPNAPPNAQELLKSEIFFGLGKAVHLVIQNLCERAGILLRREIPIFNPKTGILGHADAKLRIDSVSRVLEIKTINTYGFAALGKNPHDAHRKQLLIYEKELNCLKGTILYVEKGHSGLKEFSCDYDEVFYTKEIRPRITLFQNSLRNKKLPPREGTTRDKPPCAMCEFSKICYSRILTSDFLKKVGGHEDKV